MQLSIDELMVVISALEARINMLRKSVLDVPSCKDTLALFDDAYNLYQKCIHTYMKEVVLPR